MTAALTGASITGCLPLDQHLPECGRVGGDWRTCHWCICEIDIPYVRRLLDAIEDAETLLANSRSDTVAWVAAVTQLTEHHEARSMDALTTCPESVRALVDDLVFRIRDLIGQLDRRVDIVTAPGAAVETRCLETAGLLAAVALQSPQRADILASLPAHIKSALEAVNSRLSERTQIAELLPSTEHQLWRGMPMLHSQPEWRTIPAPGRTRPSGSDPTVTRIPAPGSLESLVVESVIDDVAGTLTSIGEDLHDLRPPVALRRAAGTTLSSRTRSLVWRTARIDWIGTFIDSGRAACWNPRQCGDYQLLEVPWTIPLAIEATEALGHVSAITSH